MHETKCLQRGIYVRLFFKVLEGIRSLCFTDQPKELQFKTLGVHWGSCLHCSKGLSQPSTGQGSGTTFSRLLNGKLGWIFFQTFMRGELLAANLTFTAFPYNS